MSNKYYYSEVFNSIQGEGIFTGQWTLWLRFFACNLQCHGFGQKFPTKPDTWELPYEDFDVSSIDRVEDLPVWDKGCDSSYTWAKKYKHLMGQKTAAELADLIQRTAATDSNPEGLFRHPNSHQTADMCFTGGEPLLFHAQRAIKEIYQVFVHKGNLPRSITFETNGTQKLTEDFKDFLTNPGLFNTPVLFSVSPKLWTVAGEKQEKAIKPNVVAEYQQVANYINSNTHPQLPSGQLKFVVGSDPQQWDELERVVGIFRDAGVQWPVYIMPVGATVEEQESTAGDVAKIAYQRGYNVSGRLHCYLFGNAIGT
jgi:6-pyruvoyltetrahydropterin 2'-reductase